MGCSVDCINDVWNDVSDERLQRKDPASGNIRHVTSPCKPGKLTT